MATYTSHNGINSGIQITENYAPINAALSQTETLLDDACLRDLRTTDPHHDKERIKNTNGGLLQDCYRWVLDNETFKQWQASDANGLLWMRGDPGKGKTMLLCGIIEELTRSRLLSDASQGTAISFFFCQATDARINNANSVLRSLIYSLVKSDISLLSHLRHHYKDAGKDLFEDANAWSALSSIFTEILQDLSSKHTCVYLVIDALDECSVGCRDLLDLIVEKSSIHPTTKWVISSRNREDIVECLANDSAIQIAPISLELNEISVSEAVNVFIRHKVDLLQKKKGYDSETRDQVYRHLYSNSQDTFLWVALVCKSLDQTPRRHVLKRLKMHVFPPGLDALYKRIMDQVRESEDAEICMEILGTVSTVYRPITLSELGSFLQGRSCGFDNFSDDILADIITACGSFLTLRDNAVVFVHQSAKDFLLTTMSAEILPNGLEHKHQTIFSHSLEILNETLRRDILDLRLPGIPTKDISLPTPNPLEAVVYACIFFVDHLCASKHHWHESPEPEPLGHFLQKKYLYWLEALSILGGISDGIHAMKKLETFIKENEMPEGLLEQAEDASRLIQYHRTGIESSPLQVYYAPLIFSPSKSLTRIAFQKERPDWIMKNPTVDEEWSSCLQTFEGHSGAVNSVAWSPVDRNRMASGSSDKMIRIWDPTTGQHVYTLKGHEDSVNSISWSPDGSQLASGSSDCTIRIWNVATGQHLSTLEGHSEKVNLINWSPDGNRLASNSSDCTIRIWNVVTGQGVSSIGGTNYEPTCWSPDGSKLALSLSGISGAILICDGTTGEIMSVLKSKKRHRDLPIRSISWSSNGNRIASCSMGNIRTWDPTTGQCLSTFEGQYYVSIESIVWSPDGSRLAFLSADTEISILDSATRQIVSILKGHSATIHSIAWSIDGNRLASGSADGMVRIWDPASSQNPHTHTRGHIDLIWKTAWSSDGSQLASVCFDGTVEIWDLASSQRVATVDGHRDDPIKSFKWSPDGSRLRLTFPSESGLNKVHVWDLASARCVSCPETFGDLYKLEENNSSRRRASTGNIDTSAIPLLIYESEGSIQVVDSIQPLKQRGYGISDNLSWMTWNGLNILWLPPEYRPVYRWQFSTYSAENAVHVAIGASSLARIVFLVFSKKQPIPGP